MYGNASANHRGAIYFSIMLRYPRIEVIKHTSFVPTYWEEYEVQTMRPNRPMKSKCGMSKAQANAYARHELSLLKKEGYSKVVYNSMMIELEKFIIP